MEWPLTVARLVDATGEEFLERVEKLDMIFERVSSVEGLSQCDPPTPPCICTHTSHRHSFHVLTNVVAMRPAIAVRGRFRYHLQIFCCQLPPQIPH